MKPLVQLSEEVTRAQENVYKANDILIQTQDKLNSELLNKTYPLLDRWTLWCQKKTYNDIANVEDYFRPPKSWKKLKELIMVQKGLNRYTGGRWLWGQELSQYIKCGSFVNSPLPDTDMAEAIECIIEYNCNKHYEAGTWDM